MADYYLDHGAYGTGSGVLGATPTWGVPQEGDGLATAASTTASTASIAMTTNPTSGQTLSICGVTFTAGTTFTIGADATATANNIAAAINASTTVVNSLVSASQPQLKTLVYARGPSGGAAAGTVELMMRVGSANLNAHTNNQITSTFGGSPTITQWNGGVSGCYGYFINEAALGQFAVNTYGVFFGFVGTLAYMTASHGVADTVYVRTGNNKTCTPANVSSGVTLQRTSSARIVFDTNTKWTGDGSTGVFTLSMSLGNSASSIKFVGSFAASSRFIALRRGGFKITTVNSGFSGILSLFVADSNTNCVLENVYLEDGSILSSVNAINLVSYTSSPSSYCTVTYINCDYVKTLTSSTITSLFAISPSNSNMKLKFEGCSFTFNISGVSDPGSVFTFATGTTTSPNLVHFTNCKFVANGYSGGLTAFPTGQPAWVSATTSHYEIKFENVIGLRYPTSFAGIPTSSAVLDQDIHNIYMNLGSTGFRFENCRGMADWNPSDNPPTLNATLPDGATSWSLRAFWFASSGILNTHTPFTLPNFKIYNRLSTGARTIGLEFVSPTALTYGADSVRMTVSYIDSSGNPKQEYSQTVASSSSSWSNATGYVAKKIELTTSSSVLTNTEISVKLELIGPPSSGSNAYIYINPDPNIA